MMPAYQLSCEDWWTRTGTMGGLMGECSFASMDIINACNWLKVSPTE